VTPLPGRRCLNLERGVAEAFLKGVHARDRVSGLTHDFYKYPARFSPLFARAAIEAFTNKGDVVLDPFMGGATTLVEARVLGRVGVGLDINELSCFIAQAKTTLLSRTDLTAIKRWTSWTARTLNIRREAPRATDWADYQRNINTRRTWAIRKSLEFCLARLALLRNLQQEVFARAVLLRTAQWALDCRRDVPSVGQFREAFISFRDEMIEGLLDFTSAVAHQEDVDTVVLHRSAKGAEKDQSVRSIGVPKLVLTSPPYPGVHVVYHRWQVLGRRETPAPYWIANRLDGSGASYYTFGDRRRPRLQTYFANARDVFGSLAQLSDANTIFVQMLAFSDASWQLPAYLEAMRTAGLEEIQAGDLANETDGRLWRLVPNRKWYADQRGTGGASSEVVLFHRRVRALAAS
jgi:hypothetical protein